MTIKIHLKQRSTRASMTAFFLILFAFGQTSFAQKSRFSATVFEDITLESDVQYGQSKTQGGIVQNLLMDIYYPKNDTMSNRPLIIFAHGGYFLFGDKLGFQKDANFFAESGYVVASINYRLIDVEQDDWVAKCAVIDAVNDMKAAVRFFNKDFQTANKYRINPTQITIGGYSAGAVTSLHYAYATEVADVLKMGGKELLDYVVDNGGLEGKSGNAGYSSKVKAVINMAGSIYSAELIDKNEPLLVSVHGTNDQVVPFMSGTTGETGVVTERAGIIHPYADKIGLTNWLIKMEGEDHLGRYSCTYCLDEIRQFLFMNY